LKGWGKIRGIAAKKTILAAKGAWKLFLKKTAPREPKIGQKALSCQETVLNYKYSVFALHSGLCQSLGFTHHQLASKQHE
jgi:hypothetical protein